MIRKNIAFLQTTTIVYVMHVLVLLSVRPSFEINGSPLFLTARWRPISLFNLGIERWSSGYLKISHRWWLIQWLFCVCLVIENSNRLAVSICEIGQQFRPGSVERIPGNCSDGRSTESAEDDCRGFLLFLKYFIFLVYGHQPDKEAFFSKLNRNI